MGCLEDDPGLEVGGDLALFGGKFEFPAILAEESGLLSLEGASFEDSSSPEARVRSLEVEAS